MKDTFTIFFEAEVDRLHYASQLVRKEMPIADVDADSFLKALFDQRRNQLPSSTVKFWHVSPYSALWEFAVMTSMSRAEFAASMVRLAGIWANRTMRTHLRGNSLKAARCAEETIQLIHALFHEVNDVDWQLRARFSELGKAGAAKRHEKMAELRRWAVEKYRAGTWASANAAAYEMQGDVLQQARLLGANLTRSNAQRTIAEWFRKSV